MFVQLEDISHNEGSLQGQKLQYPEKLHHKATAAPACSLPRLTPHLLVLHTLSQRKCCSHLLCLLCCLAIKHISPHLQKMKLEFFFKKFHYSLLRSCTFPKCLCQTSGFAMRIRLYCDDGSSSTTWV